MHKTELHAEVTPPRRNFLKILWVSLGFVALGEVILGIISFFSSTSQKNETVIAPPRIIHAGKTDAYTPGMVAPFLVGQFYLVCYENGGFMAMSAKCTHLGCAIPWDEKQQKFICPCHASQFDIFGNVLSSPAPRALDLFAVNIVNDEIQVDISTRIQRSRFNKNQLVFPETVSIIQKSSKKQ